MAIVVPLAYLALTVQRDKAPIAEVCMSSSVVNRTVHLRTIEVLTSCR
jgi:hypothetical protein